MVGSYSAINPTAALTIVAAKTRRWNRLPRAAANLPQRFFCEDRSHEALPGPTVNVLFGGFGAGSEQRFTGS
ncbi:MAG TPA: hypothetical protein VGO01_01460 [Bradyrhizobium sp.]|jgi:hypothetical protein|nr:hypothetical protein [Bradyrhizobium sp.]